MHAGHRLLRRLFAATVAFHLASPLIADDPVDLPVLQALVISGIGEDDPPIAGALVRGQASFGWALDGAPRVIDFGTQHTTADGYVSFLLDPLQALSPIDQAACELDLRVAARDHRSDSISLTLDDLRFMESEGELWVLNCTPFASEGRSSYHGRVLDARGNPVYAAQVSVESFDADNEQWLDACLSNSDDQSDDLGYFTVEAYNEAELRLVAEHPAIGHATARIMPDVELTQLVLESSNPLTVGRVVDSFGDPVSGIEVRGKRLGAGAQPDDAQSFWLYTDPNGEFSTALPDGSSWQIEVEALNGVEEAAQAVIAKSGATEIELRSTSTFLSLRVVDAKGRLVQSLMPRIYGTTQPERDADHAALPPMTAAQWGTRYCASAEDGNWLVDVSPKSRSQVWIERRVGDEWVVGRHWVNPLPQRVQSVTLVVNQVPCSKPIHASFVNSEGEPIDAWSAELHDYESGRVLTKFTTEGIALMRCVGPMEYADVRPPVGKYWITMQAESDDEYVLPARALVELNAESSLETVVRSPGFGGKLRAGVRCAAGVPKELRATRIVLTAGANVKVDYGLRRHDLHLRWPNDLEGEELLGKAERLLEAGTWTYELRGEGELVFASGVIEVQARQDASIRIP